jgi:hypothetical protein
VDVYSAVATRVLGNYFAWKADFSPASQPQLVLQDMKTNSSEKDSGKDTHNDVTNRPSIGRNEERAALRELARIVQRGPSNSAEVCAAVNQIQKSGHYKHETATWEEYCVRYLYWPSHEVERFSELYLAGRWSEVTESAASLESPPEQPSVEKTAHETRSAVETASTPTGTEVNACIELRMDEIIVEEALQCRAKLNEATVKRYAELMKEDLQCLPAPTVIKIGQQYFLVDGFHRCAAAQRLNLRNLPVNVRIGTRADAIAWSVKENASHGLPLTYEDKKRAIALLLKELPDPSDRSLAELCGASHTWVGKVRKQLATVASSGETRVGKDKRRRKLPERKTTCPEDPAEATNENASPQTETPYVSTTNSSANEHSQRQETSAEETEGTCNMALSLSVLRDTFKLEIEKCPVEFKNRMIDDIIAFVEAQRPESA